MWLRAGKTWKDERCDQILEHTTCLPFLHPLPFLGPHAYGAGRRKVIEGDKCFFFYLLTNTNWLPQVPLCCQVPLKFWGACVMSMDRSQDILCLNTKKLYIKQMKYWIDVFHALILIDIFHIDLQGQLDCGVHELLVMLYVNMMA